jgi:hypothetical protein
LSPMQVKASHESVAKAIDRVPSETMRLPIEAPRVITDAVRVPIKNSECAHRGFECVVKVVSVQRL